MAFNQALMSLDYAHGHQNGERTGPKCHHVVRFGTFELDRNTGELWSKGQRVPLQDQPAQLLSLLVSRPGTVVTREQLRKALWSEDTFVEFDTALNVAVSKIRQALRDSASTPRFIETVPKRGYRFLADVIPQGRAPRNRGWPRGTAAGAYLAAARPSLLDGDRCGRSRVVALGTWRHS